jgi:hypothetical protein
VLTGKGERHQMTARFSRESYFLACFSDEAVQLVSKIEYTFIYNKPMTLRNSLPVLTYQQNQPGLHLSVPRA